MSVEKSINRYGTKLSHLVENDGNDEENKTFQLPGKQLKLPVSDFIECCCQVSNHCGSNLQEIQFKMLNSFASLYNKFRRLDQPEESRSDLPSEIEVLKTFAKWFNSCDIIPFPFQFHLDGEFVASFSHLFLDCLKSGILVKWLSQLTPMLNLNNNLFPSHIGRIHSKEALLMDQALGHLLEMCCNILDSSSALLCLDESNALCNYFTWNVIMDHFHKRPVVATDDSSHTWPLPRILNAMLVMLQLGQVESCWNMGEQVSVKHVMRTVLKVKDDPKKIFNLLLLYLEKLPECNLLSEMEDSEIYFFTRLAFESIYETDIDSQCACGYPVSEIKKQRFHEIVGKTLLSHIYYSRGENEAILFCQKTGVLWEQFLVVRSVALLKLCCAIFYFSKSK